MERIKWAMYDLGSAVLDMAYGIRSFTSEAVEEYGLKNILLIPVWAAIAWAAVFLALL